MTPRLPLSPAPQAVLPYRDRASRVLVVLILAAILVPGVMALGAVLRQAVLAVLS